MLRIASISVWYTLVLWSNVGIVLPTSSPLANNRTQTDGSRASIGEIMGWTRTDKFFRHAYDRYYARYFEEFRDKPRLRMLEIGAEYGRSLKVRAHGRNRATYDLT
jgi:hypothetical protein